MDCPCCRGSGEDVNALDKTFSLKTGRSDASKYRRRGLEKRSRKLIQFVEDKLSDSAEVLEIGCGSGALHQDMLRRGIAKSARGIDASSGYLTAARENAEHFGLVEQIEYRQDDFAQAESEVDSAEFVVLDRVICCYPDLKKLLGRAANRSDRFLAISFPVDRLWIRLGKRVVDFVLTLMGSGYHPYIYSLPEIKQVAAAEGMQPVHLDRHFLWQILVFERSGVASVS